MGWSKTIQTENPFAGTGKMANARASHRAQTEDDHIKSGFHDKRVSWKGRNFVTTLEIFIPWNALPKQQTLLESAHGSSIRLDHHPADFCLHSGNCGYLGNGRLQ